MRKLRPRAAKSLTGSLCKEPGSDPRSPCQPHPMLQAPLTGLSFSHSLQVLFSTGLRWARATDKPSTWQPLVCCLRGPPLPGPRDAPWAPLPPQASPEPAHTPPRAPPALDEEPSACPYSLHSSLAQSRAWAQGSDRPECRP